MMRRFALFLAVALAAPLAAVDPAMLDLVAPDSKVVAGADVDRVKSSPFGQFMLNQIQEDEKGLDELMAATGFDPRRDLRELVVSSDSASGKSAHSLAIARGIFDETKIAAYASVHGGLVTTYQGVKVLTPRPGAREPGMLAFPGGGLVIAGPADAVKGALDRRVSGQRLSADLAARVQSASSRFDAWVVTTSSPANLAGRVPNSTVAGTMQGNVVQAIEYVTGGLRFGAAVEVAGEAVTKTDKDASALADVVRFLASMAVSNAPPESPMSKVVESLQLSAEGNTVKFSVTAPEQEVEKIFKPRSRNVRTKKVIYTVR